MYEPDEKVVGAPEEITIVDEEPVGPEPPEYRWALVWTITFVMLTLECSLLMR